MIWNSTIWFVPRFSLFTLKRP
uniref:Uncharacterized protein n=1 Tax=Arundo donax TaxID=35708 RepID=A0A0A8ZNV9_ARUDO